MGNEPFTNLGAKMFFVRNLNSKNCLLDASFRVKISNFGLDIDCFKPMTPDSAQNSTKRLYMAPEILRNYITNNDEHALLRRCDIYSFAILTQEIIYRRGPFYVLDENISLDEKLGYIKSVRAHPFRPFLGNIEINVWLHKLNNINFLLFIIALIKIGFNNIHPNLDNWLTTSEIRLLNSCWHEENSKVFVEIFSTFVL